MLQTRRKIRGDLGGGAAQSRASVILIHSLFAGALVGLPSLGCSSPSDHAGSSAVDSGELCAAQFDAIEKRCPIGADKDANVAGCKEQQRDYAGIGCQASFDAWLLCTSKPGYDCTQDSGCETQQNGYFICQSQAVQRTGCVRLGTQDTTRCTDAAKPYAFG